MNWPVCYISKILEWDRFILFSDSIDVVKQGGSEWEWHCVDGWEGCRMVEGRKKEADTCNTIKIEGFADTPSMQLIF
jgi:hypothetical protein